MTAILAAGPTSLERLAQAIARMTVRHGFRPVPAEVAEHFSPAGHVVLLLTEDPQRNPEVLDACVILPEALKAMSDRLTRWVADHQASPALIRRFAVARAPAVVFLRDGEYLGVLNGLRDWAEYQAEVARLLNGPPQPRPIGIPVRAADNQGACA